MKTFTLAIISLAFFASCSGSRQLATPNENFQLGGEWQLEKINGQSSEQISARKKPFIRFDEVENRISGSTGCNSFSGPLKFTDNSIDLNQPFMMTKMFCEGVDEARFMHTLERGTKFQFMNENILQIKNGDTVLMEFSRVKV
ncbi:MAG TPA: META domain-containing protein [Chryseolinea sp.]|nr:META domain-containing protein [Chryseolinea sp.]